MRRKRFFALLRMTVWATIGLTACSVKENRGDCPCWLTVRASYPNEVVSAWYGSQPIFENQDGQQVDRQVPRGVVDVVASRGKFIAQEGHQMDELFASLTKVDTQCEEAEVIPYLHRQFARVSLEFIGTEDGRVERIMQVKGNVKGADKHTLQPVEGAFRCTPDESPDGGYEVRVPRQKDDSLTLLQYDLDGKELDPIPLGYLIKKAGFDWTEESLGDVSILADMPTMTFQITVMQWQGPITMTVTI